MVVAIRRESSKIKQQYFLGMSLLLLVNVYFVIISQCEFLTPFRVLYIIPHVSFRNAIPFLYVGFIPHFNPTQSNGVNRWY